MEITMDLILYLEELARIRLTDEEKKKTLIDLKSILTYMDKLNELDTSAVEPLSHAFPITNVYREDEVTNANLRDAILANAPAQKDGCFKVPKTVE